MVHTLSTSQQTTSSQTATKKQRKKQAKREAKNMLKLEQARKDVQRAEQKVAKAQAQLEARRTRLRELEGGTMQQQHPSDQTSSGQQTSTSTPADQVTSLPPAEGRADILQDQNQDQ